MTTTESPELIAAATGGDETAFAQITARHRRELLVHCYRMLGSLDDAEDMVQETFLRAWRKRETYAGRASFRAWLYRIATNVCLDTLDRKPREIPSDADPASAFEVPWLQPLPDAMVAPTADEPHAAIVANETIELAFLMAIQHLTPQSRAAFILRDILDWSASDTAAALETSVPAANSALQRARDTLRDRLPERREAWPASTDPSADERELLARYIAANEEPDDEALLATIRDDARWAMPPEPLSIIGNRKMLDAWKQGGFGTPTWGPIRCITTRANGQPAVACYVKRPDDTTFRPMALDTLRIEDGQIAEIITFGPKVFPTFELPATL
ncbi:MAG: RNA polymerase subunit sigma-70 [Solirubrobacteraceae bacterium]|nr:RNA polymerase subunit sigma-70 [Solirubrobacteraceae bacterium]